MDQRRWKLRRIDLAGLAGCAMLALVGYLAGIRPVVAREAAMTEQQTRLRSERRAAAGHAAKAEELRRKLDGVSQALAANPVRLVPAGRVNHRIARVADLVSASGMKIDQLQPGEVAVGDRYCTIPIYLVGRAAFPTCVRLLRKFRATFPDMAVMSLEITGKPARADEPATVQFNLLWYAAASATP